MSMSRFLTCASSWAMTPSSSSCGMYFMMPVVTATTACSGFRPVANAFGCSCGAMATTGIGRGGRGPRRGGHHGHRQAGPLPEPVHHLVELGRLLLGHHLRPVHPEHDAVREEVHN